MATSTQRVGASNRNALRWVVVALMLLALGEGIALERMASARAVRDQLTRFADAAGLVQNWFRLAHTQGQITVSVNAKTWHASCEVTPAGAQTFTGYGQNEPVACANAISQMEQRYPDLAARAARSQPGG